MTVGIWILGDQLHLQQSALLSCERLKQETPVILIESKDYIKERRYHRQKLVLIWSAMRHFAAQLSLEGWKVTYAITDDFLTPLLEWIENNRITEVRIMEPNDRPFTQYLNNLPCRLNLVENNHFFWCRKDLQEYFQSRKRLVLEDFYRAGRKKFNILMEGDQPVGGTWNLDKENRQPPKGKLNTPVALWFEPDEITVAVIDEVKKLDYPLYGSVDTFRWGVTRQQALLVLDHFLQEGLANFGPYQDAMVVGEESLWHSLISPYLNLGLLTPQEVVSATENIYFQKNLPLNSVEGFIRQILGWREYMQGIYQNQDSSYSQSNWFNHHQPLPSFYWDSKKTQMNCLTEVLSQVEKTGYAHHIQRLMILNNFALIVGISPQEIETWFHAAFIDAYDWVMQTNVLGMGQFADGGILASKPYAASANYINKMSNYCSKCQYDPKQRTGEKACPFNFFYWDFLARHQAKLKSQGRINLVLGNLKRMSDAELKEIEGLAEKWRKETLML